MFWSFLSPAVLSFASSPHPHSSSFVLFFSPTSHLFEKTKYEGYTCSTVDQVCIAVAGQIWRGCLRLLISVIHWRSCFEYVCEGWGWWGSGKQTCSCLPLFNLSIMSVSHEKYLELNKYNFTCTWMHLHLLSQHHLLLPSLFLLDKLLCGEIWHSPIQTLLTYKRKQTQFLHNETNVLETPLTITGIDWEINF